MIKHFSTVDLNLGIMCEDNICPLPDVDDPEKPMEDKSCQVAGGSYIECQNQVLGETFELVGTPFTLNYLSSRTTGYKAAYTLLIPLTGQTVIPQLQRVDLEIEIAGHIERHSSSPGPNETYKFTWGGLDSYGRKLNGTHPVSVAIGYVYKAVYSTTIVFGDYPSSSMSIAAMEIIRWKYWSGRLGEWDSLGQGIAGWNLSTHHVYDPSGRTVYLGTGERRNQVAIGPSIDTVVGKFPSGCVDECPAIEAVLDSPFGIVAAANGGYYIADTGNQSIRYIDPQGIIHTVAGTFEAGFSGDGGPATQARLYHPMDVTIGLDGSLYIADTYNSRIRRVGLDGIITTVAGGGDPDMYDWGDNGPATEAYLSQPTGVAIGLDGSIFIAEIGHHAIRRVDPSGIIHTIAGLGYQLYNGDDIPALEAGLSYPYAVEVGPDGSVYIADSANRRIRRIGLDGIISTVAGNGIADYSGDGGLATEASLYYPKDVVISSNGEIFIADSFEYIVRMVDRDGIITAFAGFGGAGTANDGGLATKACTFTPHGLALTSDGALLITELTFGDVRKVAPQYPGFSLSDVVMPAEDGSQLYVFLSSGRHVSTLNALTGANSI